MQESFLHYLFEHQLLNNTQFEILSPGQKNQDAGPDFFNAKVKIGNTIWAGNVEIHICSSDWIRHKHHKDKAYDNIILHLVLQHDHDIYSTKGILIPTYEVQFDNQLFLNYQDLIDNKEWIHCQNRVKKVDILSKILFVESLAIERLKRKTTYFEELLQFNTKDWETTFYQALARGFGGKVNAIPFELLAKSIPLKVLQKHQENLIQIEALLFGQAGFLDQDIAEDSYYSGLRSEYFYLKNKYQLTAIRVELWKFSKVRPYNFPSIKIALFARLLSLHQSLLSKVSSCRSLQALNQLFDITASLYWEQHYRFGNDSKKILKKIGAQSKQHLMVNTIIPFLYVYAEKTNRIHLKENCIDWFTDLEPENNTITRKWQALGFENKNAMQSQGLIELKNERCDKHKCIDCRIGHKILTLAWNE